MHDLNELLAMLDLRRNKPRAAVTEVPDEETRPRTVTPAPLLRLLSQASNEGRPVADEASPILAAAPAPQPAESLLVRAPSEFQTTAAPMLNTPKARNMPLPGEEEANDALVRSRIESAGGFAESGDVHTRPHVARPLEFAANRLQESELAPPATSHHSRLYEMGAGALRGFALGGLGGAVYGGVRGAADPDSVARMRQQEELARDRNAYTSLYQQQKAQTDLRGDQISNEARAATIPYLLARPGLEQTKIADRKAFDAWRMTSGDRKADSAENYITWRMANGDRRATTAEGLAELRAEYVREIQPAQFERRQGETEQFHRDLTRQGDDRIGIAREGLRLRQYLGEGALDARWAGIAQGYDRLGAAQQKQLDTLAEKAAKAKAEAGYLDSTAAAETDATKKAQAVAQANLKRDEASAYHKQAEDISSRPAPQVSRPQASSRRFQGQRMPRANLPAAAKRLGMSEADAETLIVREGGVIY